MMMILLALALVLALTIHGNEAHIGRGKRGGRGRKRGNGVFLPANFTDITCTENEALPLCAPKRSDEDSTGVWVCRDRPRHDFTEPNLVTKCIDPTRSKDGDVCGFCEGDEPVTCECPCIPESDTAIDGVWVQRTSRRSGNIRQKCVSIETANSVVNTRDSYDCVASTACPSE
jgi:hypothetical protein